MSYFQVTIDVDAGGAARLESCLENLGALSVTLSDRGDEPILEPAAGETPLWSRMRAVALFDGAEHQPEAVRSALRRTLGWREVPGWQVEALPERVWERAWLDDFRPMRFGERLWVSPTTAEPPDDPGAVILRLDPGLAFGTGTHPTTALCLEWLDGLSLEGCTVIDYGCGSGILAVAALKLGAAHCLAVDNDPQALRATRENAERNGVADRLTVRHSTDAAAEPASVLVANILSGTLCSLAPTLCRALAPGGVIALSGILEQQVEEVAAVYRPCCELSPPRRREGWTLLHGRRRDLPA